MSYFDHIRDEGEKRAAEARQQAQPRANQAATEAWRRKRAVTLDPLFIETGKALKDMLVEFVQILDEAGVEPLPCIEPRNRKLKSFQAWPLATQGKYQSRGEFFGSWFAVTEDAKLCFVGLYFGETRGLRSQSRRAALIINQCATGEKRPDSYGPATPSTVLREWEESYAIDQTRKEQAIMKGVLEHTLEWLVFAQKSGEPWEFKPGDRTQ